MMLAFRLIIISPTTIFSANSSPLIRQDREGNVACSYASKPTSLLGSFAERNDFLDSPARGGRYVIKGPLDQVAEFSLGCIRWLVISRHIV
jgi:hypothetical protein